MIHNLQYRRGVIATVVRIRHWDWTVVSSIQGIEWLHELVCADGQQVYTCTDSATVPADQATHFADGVDPIIGTVAEIDVGMLHGVAVARRCRFDLTYPCRTCAICSPVLVPCTYDAEPALLQQVRAMLDAGQLVILARPGGVLDLACVQCRTCRAEYIRCDQERSAFPCGYEKIRHCYAL